MVIIFQDRIFYKNNKAQMGCFLDKTLKHNLDEYIIKGIKNKHDGIVLITGLEGTGKTTFAKTIAAYCGSFFGQELYLKNIVFSGKELMERIDEAKPGTPIIFDEAIMDMSSQDFATDMQKILIKKFTLIRKKRLLIFIVIPSIFMLRKYFAIFRTRVMINCFCPDGITRGSFRAYSFGKKKMLYLKGYKEMNMGAERPSFYGTFSDTYNFFVNEEEYEQKKDDAIKKLTEEKTTPEEKLKEELEDYKLKIKLDVEKYKEKTKERMEILRGKYIQQARGAKIKESEKNKEKIIDLRQLYIKTLRHMFKIFLEYRRLETGAEITQEEFIRYIINKQILNQSAQNLKKALQEAEEIENFDAVV